jgi:hypothetical protein
MVGWVLPGLSDAERNGRILEQKRLSCRFFFVANPQAFISNLSQVISTAIISIISHSFLQLNPVFRSQGIDRSSHQV